MNRYPECLENIITEYKFDFENVDRYDRVINELNNNYRPEYVLHDHKIEVFFNLYGEHLGDPIGTLSGSFFSIRRHEDVRYLDNNYYDYYPYRIDDDFHS